MSYQTGVDAVVVSYKTPGDLTSFLLAWELYALGDIDHTLYVVNVSPTLDDVKAGLLGGGDVHLSFPANVGYARACNAAALLGRREVIAFFNADTQITPGLLSSCSNALLVDPERAILGPRQVDDRGRITHGGIFGTSTKPVHRGWHSQDEGQYCDIRDDATTVSGSAFFIRRHVWDELTNCAIYQASQPDARGAFLPTEHYYEETWAAYHARAHGYRCTYYGPARMIHRWHRASAVGSETDKKMPTSRETFREACAEHEIDCD